MEDPAPAVPERA